MCLCCRNNHFDDQCNSHGWNIDEAKCSLHVYVGHHCEGKILYTFRHLAKYSIAHASSAAKNIIPSALTIDNLEVLHDAPHTASTQKTIVADTDGKVSQFDLCYMKHDKAPTALPDTKHQTHT